MPESIADLINVNYEIICCYKNILSGIIESYFKDMMKYVIFNTESIKIEKTYKSVLYMLFFA